MNIIQMQDRLKDLSDNQLRTYVENPRNMQGSGIGQGGTSGGYVPTYLVLGEIKRRKDSRSKYEGEKAQQKTTVAEDLVAEQGIGNQMTRNPMSQPTAGVGTPQPQEPVNPAMLAKKGIGQLDPGAVKQMNDGGIVGFEGGGEPGEELRKVQAQSQQTDYSLNDFPGLGNLDLLRNKTYEEPEDESYSAFGRFLKGAPPSIEEQKKNDLNLGTKKILDNINRREKQFKYSIFTDLTDEDREYRDAEIAKLKTLKDKVIDSHRKGKLYSDSDTEEIISETTTDETITKDVGQENSNSNQGLSSEEPPTSGAPEFLNNMAMEKQRKEMIEKGYNRFNPAGGPVEPVPDYTVADYQKELNEANTAFGIEDREAFFANRRKLIESEKEDIRKEQQDDLNANLMQTGFDIMDTGKIAAGAKKGVERYTRSEKDARKMKKLVDKEMRAVDGMERAEARGDAKGYMKERKVRKDTQLAQIKMNMDAYGDYLKSQADRFGKRRKEWIDALNWAEKTVKGDGNLSTRYTGPNGMARYKKDIYNTALEAYNNPGRMPEPIKAYTDLTPKEAGSDINTDSYWSS